MRDGRKIIHVNENVGMKVGRSTLWVFFDLIYFYFFLNCYLRYFGQINSTLGGHICQKWNSIIPHIPLFKPVNDLDHNFCRNPDSGFRLKKYFGHTAIRTRDFSISKICFFLLKYNLSPLRSPWTVVLHDQPFSSISILWNKKMLRVWQKFRKFRKILFSFLNLWLKFLIFKIIKDDIRTGLFSQPSLALENFSSGRLLFRFEIKP